jgi:hypothetical protein
VKRTDWPKIQEIYLKTKSLQKTAQLVGCSRNSVKRVIVRFGLPILHRYNQQIILETYHQLESAPKVVEQLGCSLQTVYRTLHKNGIYIGKGQSQGNKKNHHYHWKELPIETIIARYLVGETCQAIGDSYNVDAEVIRQRLKDNQINRRIGKASGNQNIFWKGGNHKETMHYYRRQSYEVAAICLGQPVLKGWVIHHMDEIPENNSPENLILFSSQTLHAVYHGQLSVNQRKGQIVDAIQLALKTGGHQLPPPPHPLKFELNINQQYLSKKQMQTAIP